SDFQCPFCRRYFTASHQQILQNYVDSGKVLFVYKHFPLSFHEGAGPYANAFECAAEQGRGEEMHDKIFEEQEKVGSGTVPYVGDETVKQWAVDLGLDAAQFDGCFDSSKYQGKIDLDFSDGAAAGVSGTPTFIIGNDDIGYVSVVGAQPYSALSQAIEQQLARV
ncbi:MAG: thioredoxin domain-containing protein, partial [Candidatus Aenigmarchaeota archaeon]|nr:thioredoxin domain-containing protein [Candidatus Aenigmarchaeota archaeon]